VPDEKIHSVSNIAVIVNSLAAEGVSAADALDGVNISKSALSSRATRVSLNQVIECYRNTARLSRDPHCAYHAGSRFHASTYGMYGFAFLSSMNFRQTMRFAVKYQQLATPVVEISFKEEGDQAILTIVPIPHPRIDASLYKFVVELQFGSFMALSRDVMGQSFTARELQVTFRPPDDAQTYPTVFGCDVLFSRPENSIVFDAAWVDGEPKLGNEITYTMVLKLCDELLEKMRLHIGPASEVRKILLVNVRRPTSLNDVAKHLHLTARTLRRKLRENNMSFRRVKDELKMEVAIKYLRDTDLTIDDMADVLGFSDAANFRRAFQRWTKRSPVEFRDISRG